MTAVRPDAYRLCLVTDEHLGAGRALTDIVAEAVAGGVTMVQVRDKRGSTRATVAAASALIALLRPLFIPLIVNDRLDVVLAVGADGLHVGQDDMPVETARKLVEPGMLVGLSITSDADLARPDAAAADYLGIGPVYRQVTKADAAPPLGIDGLARLCRLARKPVLAIGGIGADNAADVMRAGADGIAVVSAIMGAADARAAARELHGIVSATAQHATSTLREGDLS